MISRVKTAMLRKGLTTLERVVLVLGALAALSLLIWQVLETGAA